MKNNPANVVKDTMLHFLIDGRQRGNAKALKEAVYDLIGMTTQKNSGQRKAKKDIDWDSLDMTVMTIVIEATALILSGELDEKEEKKKPKDVTVLNDALCENYKIGLCGSCECVVDNTENYCRKCGQKLNWSEKDEDINTRAAG